MLEPPNRRSRDPQAETPLGGRTLHAGSIARRPEPLRLLLRQSPCILICARPHLRRRLSREERKALALNPSFIRMAKARRGSIDNFRASRPRHVPWSLPTRRFASARATRSLRGLYHIKGWAFFVEGKRPGDRPMVFGGRMALDALPIFRAILASALGHLTGATRPTGPRKLKVTSRSTRATPHAIATVRNSSCRWPTTLTGGLQDRLSEGLRKAGTAGRMNETGPSLVKLTTIFANATPRRRVADTVLLSRRGPIDPTGLMAIEISPGSRARSVHTCQGLRPRRLVGRSRERSRPYCLPMSKRCRRPG